MASLLGNFLFDAGAVENSRELGSQTHASAVLVLDRVANDFANLFIQAAAVAGRTLPKLFDHIILELNHELIRGFGDLLIAHRIVSSLTTFPSENP